MRRQTIHTTSDKTSRSTTTHRPIAIGSGIHTNEPASRYHDILPRPVTHKQNTSLFRALTEDALTLVYAVPKILRVMKQFHEQAPTWLATSAIIMHLLSWMVFAPLGRMLSKSLSEGLGSAMGYELVYKISFIVEITASLIYYMQLTSIIILLTITIIPAFTSNEIR